jgi:hypothetical protein
MIVRQTQAFRMCLEPARDQKSIYRPVIDNYEFKNKRTLVLERKFKLSAYTLIAPEHTRDRTFSVLSAVGFNRARTRALVCWEAYGSGTCHFMLKKKGTWGSDPSWRGNGCVWDWGSVHGIAEGNRP